MTSRERVEAALEYRPVDRVPMDCTLSISACNNIIDYLKLPVEHVKECNVYLMCFPEPKILKAFGIDCTYVPINPPSKVKPFRYGETEYTNEFGVTYRRTETPSGYEDMQVINAPLEDIETVEELEAWDWPDPNDDCIYEGLRERAKDLYENSDLALVGYFGGSMFTLASQMRGMENWLCDLIVNREFAVALMEKLRAYFTTVYCRCIEECGEYLSFIRTDFDDYGGQNNELISPQMFDELVSPVISRYYADIKKAFLAKNPHGKLMKHTCGSVFHLIDRFIAMGIDMLDPIQPTAGNMSCDKLAATFKGRIAFHEGIDTQRIMPNGTPEEVAAEAKRVMETLTMENGSGYLIGTVHHMQPDVPPVNFIALRDAVQKYGVFDPSL